MPGLARPLRIAVVGTRGFPDVQGGVEKHCEELYPRLVASGCRVSVYARAGYVEKTRHEYQGVTILPLWTLRRKNLEAVVHTFMAVLHIGFTRKHYDLVHFHAIGPSLFVPLARLFGLRVVMTHHGADYERKKWGVLGKALLRLGEKLGTRWSTKVIAISCYGKDMLEHTYHRPVVYIPNGVTIPGRIEPGAALSGYGLAPKKYVLAVGRLVPEKGFPDLLEAFAGISTDWHLVIAGGADHEDAYADTVRNKAGRDDRVKMTGFISGGVLAELYSQAGCFVAPSYHEGLPIAVLEAMSYGLPVLATNIPGNRGLITDAGRLFTPGDIAALRALLRERIAHPDTPGETCNDRDRILREFNWERISEETLDVYASCCSEEATC